VSSLNKRLSFLPHWKYAKLGHTYPFLSLPHLSFSLYDFSGGYLPLLVVDQSSDFILASSWVIAEWMYVIKNWWFFLSNLRSVNPKIIIILRKSHSYHITSKRFITVKFRPNKTLFREFFNSKIQDYHFEVLQEYLDNLCSDKFFKNIMLVMNVSNQNWGRALQLLWEVGQAPIWQVYLSGVAYKLLLKIDMSHTLARTLKISKLVWGKIENATQVLSWSPKYNLIEIQS